MEAWCGVFWSDDCGSLVWCGVFWSDDCGSLVWCGVFWSDDCGSMVQCVWCGVFWSDDWKPGVVCAGSTGAAGPRLFTIHQVDISTNNLPKAHTWYIRLLFPFSACLPHVCFPVSCRIDSLLASFHHPLSSSSILRPCHGTCFLRTIFRKNTRKRKGGGGNQEYKKKEVPDTRETFGAHSHDYLLS